MAVKDTYKIEMAIDMLRQSSNFLKQGGCTAKSMIVDSIIQKLEIEISLYKNK